MTDDLRTRIKHAIDQAHASSKPHSTYDDWLTFAADAVILELGLTIQVAGPDGIAYGKHRYVTDWIAND